MRQPDAIPAVLGPASRYDTVDMLRALAIFAVVCIHTAPFEPALMDDEVSWMTVVHFIGSTLSLFAVPFFFAASGFFYGRSHQRMGSVAKAFRRFVLRIAPLFVVWSLAYDVFLALYSKWDHGTVAVFHDFLRLLHQYVERPGQYLFTGGSYQLWFLASLLQAAAIVSLCVAWRRPTLMLVIGATLYAVGLQNQGYDLFHLSPVPSLNTRIGPFFSTLFFALGYRVSFRRVPRPGLGPALVVLGVALLFAERAVLEFGLHGHLGEYYLGSVPLGMGLMLWALDHCSEPSTAARPSRAARFWAHTGRLSLGVYLTHVMFIDLFEGLDWDFMDHWGWQVLFPVLVYSSALCATALMARTQFLRRLAT